MTALLVFLGCLAYAAGIVWLSVLLSRRKP